MREGLCLVRIPILAGQLARVARRKHVPLREMDEGYLCHCVMRDLWQERAPAPFLLRGRGRILEAWGYSECDATELVEYAREHPDQTALAAIADLAAVASKPIPLLPVGQQIGFLLRACPVVRLATARAGHKAGAEVDAFLARCFRLGPNVVVSREEVYREWLAERLNTETSGVAVGAVRVDAVSRERLVRRTQADERVPNRIQRPDVRFSGVLTITDTNRFLEIIARGVGRHRAFGFGALILVPRGTSWGT